MGRRPAGVQGREEGRGVSRLQRDRQQVLRVELLPLCKADAGRAEVIARAPAMWRERRSAPRMVHRRDAELAEKRKDSLPRRARQDTGDKASWMKRADNRAHAICELDIF